MTAPATCVIVCPHCLTRLDVHAPPVRTIREMVSGGMLQPGSVFPHKRLCHECDGAAFLFWRERNGSVALDALGFQGDDETIATERPIAFVCFECDDARAVSVDQGAPFCRCGAALIRPPMPEIAKFQTDWKDAPDDATPDAQANAPRAAVGDRASGHKCNATTPERD